jgi:signal transduction histidine kinase
VTKEIHQREKLSTMGELATVLAHEIKNPMNSIIIHLEVLKSCFKELAGAETLKDKAARNLHVIESEMKRLEKVISGFLDLAGSHPNSKESFAIQPLILELVELLQPEFQKNEIEIRLDLHSDLPPLVGSADQIKQAVLNLLINAHQALPKGGEISIRTGFDSKLLWIEVSDNGLGISNQIKNQIFSPYFTTKEKGSGLGLSIIRRITREHGGYVEVESEEGNGASFRLIFPISKGD